MVVADCVIASVCPTSVIVTSEAVATIVPDVESVLIFAVKVSPSSVIISPTTLTLKDPVLLLIKNDHASVPPTKSSAVAVPDRV